MSWEILLEKDVQAFIDEHEGDDVAALALKKTPNKDWLYPIILDQIKVRQKAAIKTPKLRDTRGFVFPANFLYEQASSEACAAYKALIVNDINGGVFADLTAGAGVDSFFLSKKFSSGFLIEKNTDNAEILTHNVQIMGGDLEVKNESAEDFVRQLLHDGNKVSLVYIDPQRREDARGKKGFFDFEKCSPNILELMPNLEKVSDAVLIKTAPFLDIDKAIEQLSACLSKPARIDVHILQWAEDCKEVLYYVDFSEGQREDGALITAVDLEDDGGIKNSLSFHRNEERNAEVSYAMPKPRQYIYEPGPAFQKSGGYKYISQHFCLDKLHEHTHLYVSDAAHNIFPGKKYRVIDVFPLKSKVLPIEKADLAVRNFPQSVAVLKKKLALRDGGIHRVYATTTYDNKKSLILCEKG